MGMLVLTIISLFFIDENDLDNIKQKVKNIKSCTDENFKNFGIKKSFDDLSYIFGVIGAFWGASFTVEKNIGKWWGGESKRIFIIKVISIISVNAFFILVKFLMPKLFDSYEINFIISSLLNFFQNFCSFGMIPLFLQHMELIEKKKLKKNEDDINSKESIKDEEDDTVILFKTSIFKDEKQKGDDEGFVILDKEVVKKDKIKEENKIEENNEEENKEEYKDEIKEKNKDENLNENKNEEQ
jgi:hypothetical protein